MLRSLIIKGGLGVSVVVIFFLLMYAGLWLTGRPPIVWSFGTPWMYLVVLTFFAFPFLFPYLKIQKGGWFAKGVFFGLLMWAVYFPEAWFFVTEFIIQFGSPASLIYIVFSPITAFILAGIVTSFGFKKVLPVQYQNSYSKIKIALPIIVVLLGVYYFAYQILPQFLYNLYYGTERTAPQEIIEDIPIETDDMQNNDNYEIELDVQPASTN